MNRRVNCEAANVDKTVDAALEQRRAIQILRRAALWTS
ncbi:MAG: helix-turn-helix domain-containing protein [Evtepia sp.]